MLFEKKVTIFQKKDRRTWEEIRRILKDAGLKKVSAGHYFQDDVIPCGCGSKLDPRDFGKKGKIDRDIYFVDVREADAEQARQILRDHGIEC